MEKIYTVPQVAEYLQISRSKMYDWVRKGKIPYILIGRNKRIRESDLQAWIDANLVNYEFPFQLSFLETAENEKK
jgi:excisionase family DNA binding protein